MPRVSASAKIQLKYSRLAAASAGVNMSTGNVYPFSLYSETLEETKV